jgi:hypothetical protein
MESACDQLITKGRAVLMPSIHSRKIAAVIVGFGLTDPNWVAIHVNPAKYPETK